MADGNFARYPEEHMLVCMEWMPQGVNLGGTAEVSAFVLYRTRVVFLWDFAKAQAERRDAG